MIYFLCGEMGSGKNYVGVKLARYLDADFFDGDVVMTEEMKVKRFKYLSKETIDQFIQRLMPEIAREYYVSQMPIVI